MGINGTWVHSSKIIPPKLKKKKKKKLLVLLLTCFPTQQLFAMCHFIEFKLLSETLRPVFEAY